VPTVVVLCFFGSFAMRNFIADVIITLIFGLVGFILYKSKWPLPCLVLGFVLGDLVEANFHRTLIMGHGSAMPLITKPASLLLLMTSIVLLCWPYITAYFFNRQKLIQVKGLEIPEEVEK
jgi:putative tricarboxylic transport membrane protein